MAQTHQPYDKFVSLEILTVSIEFQRWSHELKNFFLKCKETLNRPKERSRLFHSPKVDSAFVKAMFSTENMILFVFLIAYGVLLTGMILN